MRLYTEWGRPHERRFKNPYGGAASSFMFTEPTGRITAVRFDQV